MQNSNNDYSNRNYEQLKQSVLRSVEENFTSQSVASMEKVVSPFDKDKRKPKKKWMRITLQEGFGILFGYDFQKYWMMIDEVPKTFPLGGLAAEEMPDGRRAYTAEDLDGLSGLIDYLASIHRFPQEVKAIIGRSTGVSLSGGIQVRKQPSKVWFSFSTLQGLKVTFYCQQGVFSMAYDAPKFPIKKYATRKVEGKPGFASTSLEDVKELLQIIIRDLGFWMDDSWEMAFGSKHSLRFIRWEELPFWLVVVLTAFLAVGSTIAFRTYEPGGALFTFSLLSSLMGGIMVAKALLEWKRFPLFKDQRDVIFKPLFALILYYASLAWYAALLTTLLVRV